MAAQGGADEPILHTMAVNDVATAGIVAFGIGMEANPIVAAYLITLGPPAGLVCVKLLAIACAAFLHCVARHVLVGVLTIGLLTCAIVPWVQLLWP